MLKSVLVSVGIVALAAAVFFAAPGAAQGAVSREEGWIAQCVAEMTAACPDICEQQGWAANCGAFCSAPRSQMNFTRACQKRWDREHGRR